MRWKTKPVVCARTVWRFLIVPRTIGGQTRWLEFARIRQAYVATFGGGGWVDVAWADHGEHRRAAAAPFGRARDPRPAD